MIPRRGDFRSSVNYAAAVASELAAPALRLAARLLARGAAAPPTAWRRGVIFGNAHIGDVLYRTCSLQHLAASLPRCEWTYVAAPASATVLEGNPALTHVLPIVQGESAAAISDLDAIRTREFDVALCTENTRGYEALLLATRLGIPNRVGFVQKGFSGLATIGVPLAAPMSRPAQFRRMVETITRTPDDSPLRPRVHPTAADRESADAEWRRLGLDDAGCVIASAITTRQTTGAFPPEFFAALLSRIVAARPDARVLLLGSTDDRAALDAVGRELGDRAVISEGRLGLRGVVPLLARCAAFVGSDSGPRHLANAAEIPVFFVRNMGGSQAESGWYCATEVDIAPAGEYLSPAEMLQALARVDLDAVARDVVAAADAQSARYSRR